jgi:hypothetical protein
LNSIASIFILNVNDAQNAANISLASSEFDDVLHTVKHSDLPSIQPVPALFVVVFGTQEVSHDTYGNNHFGILRFVSQDILKVWMFWRKDTTESQMLGPKDLKIINDA